MSVWFDTWVYTTSIKICVGSNIFLTSMKKFFFRFQNFIKDYIFSLEIEDADIEDDEDDGDQDEVSSTVSNLSELSGLSNISGQDWKGIAG